MSYFASSIALFKQNSGLSAEFIDVIPEKTQYGTDLSYYLLNSFPVSKSNAESIFVYTIRDTMVCAWTFMYNNERYSISVTPNKNSISVFMDMFLATQAFLISEDLDIPPTSRVDLIWSYISTWYVENRKDGHFQMPGIKINASMGKELRCFRAYSPFSLFPKSTNYFAIWKKLIYGEQIIVTAPKVEHVFQGVLSILSLITPFSYRGNVLIVSSKNDPRLQSASDYDIIGCTSDAVLSQNNGYVLGVSPRKEAAEKDLKQVFEQKTAYLRKILLCLMNQAIINNPYNDIIDGLIVPNALDLETVSDIVTQSDISHFIETPTFKQWRFSKFNRPFFRCAFLSCDPKILFPKLSKDACFQIENRIEDLKREYHDDAHVLSVFNFHKRVLKELKNKM